MFGRCGLRRVSAIQRGFSTSRLNNNKTGNIIQIDEAVQDALAHNRPVVALESTIVAHGMPYPENLNLSKKVASILRSKGVEPATIAVRDGVCRVGLSPDELEDLAQAGEEGRAQKCSTRELSLILAKQKNYDFSRGHQWGGMYRQVLVVVARWAELMAHETSVCQD
jgi:hypothetical protein